MLWNLLKSLKPATLVLVVVVWNALCLFGIWLNGGMGRIETLPAAMAMVVTCGALSFVALATAQSGWWQRVALRPDADPAVARPGLLFIGALGAILAVGGVFTAIHAVGSHT